MPSRFEMNAVLTAENRMGDAFAAAAVDAKALGEQLDALDRERVNVTVNVFTHEATRELVEFEVAKEVAGKDITVNVDVDAGAAVTELAALEVAARGATGAIGGGGGGASLGAVGAARGIAAGGLLAAVAALTPAIGLALAAVRPLTGGLVTLGGLGATTAAGVGLVAAAGFRLQQAMQDGAKYTDGLNKEWQELKRQFTGPQGSSVFDQAARGLAPLATQILRLANQAMPALGREATEVVKEINSAFSGLSRNLGSTERNSLTRILDSASDVMGELTRAAGKAGGAIANIFGNRAVVGAAEDLAKWLDRVAGDFLDWTRSEQGIKTINGLIKDARTFMQDLGEALRPVAKAMGEFGSDDVKTLGEALRGIGRIIGALITTFHDIVEAIGAAQRFTDRYNLRLENFGGTLRALSRLILSVRADFMKWANDTAQAIQDWIVRTGRGISSWVQARTRDFNNWRKDVSASVSGWASDTLKSITGWASDTEKRISDWIKGRITAFKTFVGDVKTTLSDGFHSAADAILDALDSALGPIDEWVSTVVDKLNQIFDMLGIGGGDSKGSPAKGFDKSGSNPHSGSSDPAKRYEGGIYDTNNVRFMHEGGMVDASGVYTALTTGMSRAMSEGSVWQAATGGISDGMAPRVVYGEGPPGAGPKKEAYIPEDMEPARAMDTLAEAARWFGARVGFGSEQPHAHFLPESERQSMGGGTWVMNQGGVGVYPGVYPLKMASGGMTLGIEPPNSILNTFMEYIPGYPYGNEHHLGVDVVPGGSRNIHAPAAFAVTDVWDRSSYGEGTFVQYNVKSKDGGTYSAFAGHTTGGAPNTGKPDQVMTTIGPYSGWGGGPDHMHLQTAPHPSPVGMDPGGLVDPFNWWGQVGGSTEIPPGYSGGGGFDVWGAVQGLINKIPKPDFGSGPYFTALASGAYSAVIDGVTQFAKDHLPAFLGGSGGVPDSSGGNLEAWAKQGLQYGAVVDASSGNVQKIVTLAMKESGGDPNAVNPEAVGSYGHASGLMQLLPTTFDAYNVAAGDDIFNPVDNVAASSRYQVDRYGGLVTFSPYSQGGMALRPHLARVGDNGPEMMMPFNTQAGIEVMKFLRTLPEKQLGDVGPREGIGTMESEVRALRREVRGQTERLEDALTRVGIDEDSQRGVGEHAAGGTIYRVTKPGPERRKVAGSLDTHYAEAESLMGRFRD